MMLVSSLSKHIWPTITTLTRFSSTTPTPKEIELFVNGKSVKVEPGTPIIQACAQAGVEIPRFCYHERLAIAGNCRMCLVEVEKIPKPVASCAMPVSPGMRILTDSPMTKKAREGVMEFLLANHPLDCPICDQGGECDLQDQSMAFGSDRGRFNEFSIGKRAVEDKNFGPLVKTVMNRCIHCTRCVRFAVDVAGMDELGTSGRGNDMQIGTYIEKTLSSELSGNIIDLCPVGALTSKPYAFQARPWELKRTETIDVMDAVGSNIRVDSRGQIVMRIMPRLNEDINEEWISDKTRFACDGLRRQRITSPMLRTENNTFTPISWSKALSILHSRFSNANRDVSALIGGLADVESIISLKDLFQDLGINKEQITLDGKFHSPSLQHGFTDNRSNYILNTPISELENSDCILLIGTHPRHEAPMVNSRIRKAYLKGATIGLIGPESQLSMLNYTAEHIGTRVQDLLFSNPKLVSFYEKYLKLAKRPVIILGSGVLERPDVQTIFSAVNELCCKVIDTIFQSSWNGYGLLHREAGRVGALDVGVIPGPPSKFNSKLIYLLNADDINHLSFPSDAFIVYQGHHGDIGASRSHLVLPGCAYTEKDATFVNVEGRSQMTKTAVPPPNGAREDWQIICAIAEVLGHPLPYSSGWIDLRDRISQISSHLISHGQLASTISEKNNINSLVDSESNEGKKRKGKKIQYHNDGILELPINDFYMTDPISRNSQTMAECSRHFTYGQPYRMDLDRMLDQSRSQLSAS